MKDLKRKIHYWCSDTMQNKITGKGVVCAVLDTGITQHPDLVGRIVGWKDCVQGKKTIYDDNGHGTHVAGILAGNGKRKRTVQRNGTGGADLCCQGAESERWWKNPGCDKRDPVRVVKTKGNEDPDRQYFDWNSSS